MPDKDIEGYGSHRVCHGCGLGNREQRLVASGGMILPEDGVAEGGNFGVVRANIRAAENDNASPRLVAPSAGSSDRVEAFMEAVYESDQDSDDYVRDDDDSSSTDEDYVSDWGEVGVRHKDVTTCHILTCRVRQFL